MADEDAVSSTSDPVVTTAMSVSPTNDLDLRNDIQVEEESGQGQNTIQGFLVSPSLANPTLQNLLTSPVSLQSGQLLNTDGIQILTIQSSPTDLVPANIDASGKVWHVINPATLISFDDQMPVSIVAGDVPIQSIDDAEPVSSSDLIDTEAVPIANVLMPPPPVPPQKLPPGCPNWAARMKSCEKIGVYYRGYVDTEMELDLLLTYHKQQTQSFWGTRQSPSPAKPSTRMMWKSQYVPFDGVPFINSGSRAVVMECQYGPRRKGNTLKRNEDFIITKGDYKQTCPARIYIKKVRKFPEYGVDINMDKKSLKNAMDKAFHELKSVRLDTIGQERYYVQLPIETAHEFHDEKPATAPPPNIVIDDYQPVPVLPAPQEPDIKPVRLESTEEKGSRRLHPKVVNKIRELVAGGEVRVYAIRRLLRAFVTREVCSENLSTVQRHDLTLFPTVHDLKNQIHQAIKDIENGTLPLTASTVNVELLSNTADGMMSMDPSLWQQNVGTPQVVPETVTVTLTQNPGEDGSHVISRVETHLSDGTTQISTSLTPETAQLLARLNPSMFPAGSLVQLQNMSEELPAEVAESQEGMEIGERTLPTVNNIPVPDMNIQLSDQEASQAEGNISDGDMRIISVDSSEASDMITQENHSISNQSEELISVSMVPNVSGESSSIDDVLANESSDDDL